MESKPRPSKISIPHIEAAHFRTVPAGGVIISGPLNKDGQWLLTFYSEGSRIVSESLVSSPDLPEGAYRYPDNPEIEVERIRRDEVCILLSQDQLKSLASILSERMGSDEQ